MPRKGQKLTPEHKEAIRQAHLGMKKPWAGKAKRSEEWKKNHSESMKGEKHWNWQGGKTVEVRAARNSKEYKDWRVAVFERDDYTCQFCGKRGGYLEADHIKSFAKFKELRYELSNGRTLCKPCHETTPTHSNGSRTVFNNQYTKDLLENKLIEV